MPFNFGAITRFAGDHLQTGYNALDSKVGGFLPGGVEADGIDLVKEVARDAMPGQRVHGDKLAASAAANTSDAAKGRVDLVATRSRAGALGGKAREHLVEEGIERVGREGLERLGKRSGLYAIPIAGQALAVGDTVMDAMNGYDALVTATTGKGFGQHVDATIAMRDSQRGLNAFPDAGYVGTGTHTMGQGTQQNPILQEITNRATLASRNFNPVKGDFGFSEVMGWN